MEKTHEDSSKEIFEGYIKEGVFIQQGIYQRKHQLFVRDYKFYNGLSDISVQRGQNITIEGAYEMEAAEHLCYFKMAAEDSDE